MEFVVLLFRGIYHLLLYVIISIYYTLQQLVLAFVPQYYKLKDVSKETVLITGGGNGIGKELAKDFSKRVAKLILLDIRIDDLRETAKWLKREGAQSEIFVYECDVSKKEAVYAMASKIQKEIGTVTMLINNAGIVNGKPFMELSDDAIQKTMEVNTLAHIWTCKAFLPDMLKTNHGHIVSIASIAGYTTGPNLTDYCASKYAVVGLMESLRAELKFDNYNGIQITLVAPYHIDTKLFRGVKLAIRSYSPEFAAGEIVKGVLMNKEVFSVPTYFMAASFILTCFPRKAIRMIKSCLGMDTCMKDFKGREA